jgi:AcrR family transcriptional regulator
VSTRRAPAAWCDAGLTLLRDEGISAITVERLCQALKCTKGSFYHHFRDLEAFLDALIVRWEDTLTTRPIAHAASGRTAKQRIARLDTVVAGLDHALDLAMRAWALRDPRAREAMARVDARRLDYLTELLTAAGVPHPRKRAQLEYAAFVGAQQLGALLPRQKAARFAADVHRALLRTDS